MVSIDYFDDLMTEVNNRTQQLLDDPTRDFAYKAAALGNIASIRLGYDPWTLQEYFKRAGARQVAVAALVECDITPLFTAVFIGKLEGDDPLKMDAAGDLELGVKSGVMARVFTTTHNQLPWIKPADRYDDKLVPITEPRSLVLHGSNEITRRRHHPVPITRLADTVLAKAEGLAYAFAHQGLNLPRVSESGIIEASYDQMGLVALLGQSDFTEAVHFPQATNTSA